MAKGTVKWFNNAKGYGFLRTQDTQEDVFIHFSVINLQGYKSLKAGQEVLFEAQSSAKGLHATEITLIASEALPLPEKQEPTAQEQ